MVDQAKAARIAAYIFDAHQRKERFQRLRGELAPASLGEAYTVQTRSTGCSARRVGANSAVTRSR